MKYHKLFNNHTEYNEYIDSSAYIKPSLAYCKDVKDVHYRKKVKNDYSEKYLTTEAYEDGTISFNIWSGMGTEYITSISYSTNNGETWTTVNNTDNKSEHLSITVNVQKDDVVLWKGDAKQTGYYDEDDYGDNVGSFFSSTAEFIAYGNIMSLLYGDNFSTKTTLNYDG